MKRATSLIQSIQKNQKADEPKCNVSANSIRRSESNSIELQPKSLQFLDVFCFADMLTSLIYHSISILNLICVNKCLNQNIPIVIPQSLLTLRRESPDPTLSPFNGYDHILKDSNYFERSVAFYLYALKYLKFNIASEISNILESFIEQCDINLNDLSQINTIKPILIDVLENSEKNPSYTVVGKTFASKFVEKFLEDLNIPENFYTSNSDENEFIILALKFQKKINKKDGLSCLAKNAYNRFISGRSSNFAFLTSLVKHKDINSIYDSDFLALMLNLLSSIQTKKHISLLTILNIINTICLCINLKNEDEFSQKLYSEFLNNNKEYALNLLNEFKQRNLYFTNIDDLIAIIEALSLAQKTNQFQNNQIFFEDSSQNDFTINQNIITNDIEVDYNEIATNNVFFIKDIVCEIIKLSGVSIMNLLYVNKFLNKTIPNLIVNDLVAMRNKNSKYSIDPFNGYTNILAIDNNNLKKSVAFYICALKHIQTMAYSETCRVFVKLFDQNLENHFKIKDIQKRLVVLIEKSQKKGHLTDPEETFIVNKFIDKYLKNKNALNILYNYDNQNLIDSKKFDELKSFLSLAFKFKKIINKQEVFKYFLRNVNNVISNRRISKALFLAVNPQSFFNSSNK